MEIKDYRSKITGITGNKISTSTYLNFEDALLKVREKMKEIMEERGIYGEGGEEKEKDKNHLRASKTFYASLVREAISKMGVRVRDYDDDVNNNQLTKDIVNEIVGFSVLEDAMSDNTVTDIFCNAWNNIIVEGYNGIREYDKKFRNPEHFRDFISKLVSEAHKEFNDGDKRIVDFDLYGDRFCAISSNVATAGDSLTIRKHFENKITLDKIIEQNVMDEKTAKFLRTIVTGEMNLIIAGKTGSGKTTSMRALLEDCSNLSTKRILVCEDTKELNIATKHALSLVSVRAENSNKYAVSLMDVIYTALRQKPRQIVVGEVRGEESMSAVEAMETGHSTIFSMHGGNPWNILNRLITKYLMAMPSLSIEVVERIIGSAVDYIVIQSDIPRIGKKISAIYEITYDFEKRTSDVKPIMEYDFKENRFVFLNKISYDKAYKLLINGASPDEIDEFGDTSSRY